MRYRLSKRLDSKYCTAFDLNEAKAFVRGIMYLANEAYGVLSIIRIDEYSDIKAVKETKHLLFAEKEEAGECAFVCYGTEDGHFMEFDAFASAFARRLRVSEKYSVIISLDLYDYEEDTPVDELLARGKKEHYSWYAEEFLMLPTDFTKSSVLFPPGCSFIEDHLVQNEDHQGALRDYQSDLGDVVNEADGFVDSLLEYSYQGAHAFTALWQKEDNEWFASSVFFAKSPEGIGLILPDDTLGSLEYHLMVENIEHRMLNGEKTYLLLNSVVTDSVHDGVSNPSELRGWELKGKTIHSLDDRTLEALVTVDAKDIFEIKNLIFCDSWDYPVTRHDDDGL